MDQGSRIRNQSWSRTELAIFSSDSLQTVKSGKVGRPKYSISEDVLHNLRSSRFTWTKMASCLTMDSAASCSRMCSLGVRFSTNSRIWKGIFGTRDLTKIWCGNRENDKYIDGIRDLTVSREAGLAQNRARDAGCGMYVCMSVRNVGNRHDSSLLVAKKNKPDKVLSG